MTVELHEAASETRCPSTEVGPPEALAPELVRYCAVGMEMTGSAWTVTSAVGAMARTVC